MRLTFALVNFVGLHLFTHTQLVSKVRLKYRCGSRRERLATAVFTR